MAGTGMMQCGQLSMRGSTFQGLRKGGVTQSNNNSMRQQNRGGSKRSVAVRCGEEVKVRVRLDHQVQFGEWHAILGSAKSTGSWQEKVPMKWTESGWVVDVEGKPGETVEYKHVIVTHDGNVIWEEGPNRTLSLPNSGDHEVVTHWGQTQEQLQFQQNGHSSFNGHASAPAEAEQPLEESSSPNVVEEAVQEMSTSFVKSWQGVAVQDRKQRSGKWDTSGLDGPALQIVEGDKSASNWWRKLDVVRELLSTEVAKTERLKTLVNAAVYLKWINTGQIVCYEDGQHYRPNKHAEISRRIFVELERITGAKDVSLKEKLVIQKIHPCLPAFKAEFTASVPLTRIRDIAHRNDIPHDLKQEIKHTIQNKLHRSAGPEDLVATELMLARVTKNPGQYSEAFVNEFRTFYAELKDFFNAGSLTEQLEGLRDSMDDSGLPILDHFLSSKANLDKMNSSENVTESVLGTLHALTCLRERLLQGLESGLRNDASDAAIAMRQKWRLSELGLEDYSFVLLSRLINAFESEGGAGWLAEEVKGGRVGKWTPAVTSLAMAVQQLGLSGLQKQECSAVKNELLAWTATGILDGDTKAWALRLKATIDRVRRLAEAYTDTVLQLYPDYVEKLGNALGIPENTVRTYTEADIRASVVFQIAKLCSFFLKAIRLTAGGDGFDVIMPGRATGKLVEVDRIVPGSLPSSATGSIILLVKQADGDEEVKAAGSNVAGVILQHELPHLSHLGVRARQEKVVFVTCDDEERSASLRTLLNKSISLTASAESVHVGEHDGSQESSPKPQVKAAAAAPSDAKQSVVVRSPPGTVLDLSKATTENSGSKAAACGDLAVVCEKAKNFRSPQEVSAAFRVPRGKVIPFGAMEDTLEASGALKEFKSLLEKVETAALEGGELDTVCNELQSLVAAQRPAKAILEKLASDGFPSDARLIVRSSANVEDLAGMSGAGLYESIPNVKLSEPENFGKAVAQVWASLYTRRAVLSRRVAGVPQKEASMAVLVQELLAPELSFVLHTVSPIDQDEKVVQAEIAVGLGETLASGTRGTPWRLAANKFDGTVKTLAFANFSEQMMVREGSNGADGSVVHAVVDYSSQPLSTDAEYRHRVGQMLATVGFFLEKHFGVPQDIEGCVIGKDVYIVQARPQP